MYVPAETMDIIITKRHVKMYGGRLEPHEKEMLCRNYDILCRNYGIDMSKLRYNYVKITTYFVEIKTLYVKITIQLCRIYDISRS